MVIKSKKGKKHAKCDFCGKSTDDGVAIIASHDGTAICDACSRLISAAFECGDNNPNDKTAAIPKTSMNEEYSDSEADDLSRKRLLTPSAIVAELDKYVIGQNETKRTLAVAVYNHYCRLKSQCVKPSDEEEAELSDTEIEKSNVLMIGPTGCGKTLIAKTLAKILDVPFAIADATTLTEAGYVGEDVENVVRYLYNNAGRDVKRAERGIIVIDEIDKIATKTQNVSITRDVSGEGVQQALLKIIEGTVCRFPLEGGRKHPEAKLVEVDTSNILFICGGAFVGLSDIVEKRQNKTIGAIGFSDDRGCDGCESSVNIIQEDLIAYGLIPEFVGRLPVIAELKELSEDELFKVLTEPKNCLINQYRKLLLMSGVKLKIEDEAVHKLVQLAIKRKTGARGLRAQMENIMRDVMFNAPDNKEKNRTEIITCNTVDSKVA